MRRSPITAFHETGHYVYAAPWLNLIQGWRFGSAAYAFEELVVSIAAVNICTVVGVQAEIETTASYLAGLMAVIWSNRKVLAAHERMRFEARLPRHLLYVKGWPTIVPTREDAEMLASIRRRISALLGIDADYLTGPAVRKRYQELFGTHRGNASFS